VTFFLAEGDTSRTLLAASLCSGALTDALDWQHLEQGGSVTLVFDALPHQKATLAALEKTKPTSE